MQSFSPVWTEWENLKAGLTDSMPGDEKRLVLGITAMGPSFHLLDTFF